VGNGDLTSPSQAAACLGNLDGVMIGRAAMSDPGLPGRIHHELHKHMGPSSNVTAEDWMIYLEESLQCYPQSFACRRMRKTLIGLLGPHADPALQQLARTVENAQDIQRVLSGVKFKEHKTHAFQATPGHEGESTVPSAIEI
jgi:tRNA-dihydrouridine synthase